MSISSGLLAGPLGLDNSGKIKLCREWDQRFFVFHDGSSSAQTRPVLGALRRRRVLLRSLSKGIIHFRLMRCTACRKMRFKDGPCASATKMFGCGWPFRSKKPFRWSRCSVIVASTAVVVDLTRLRRLWGNELRQRRSRSLSARTGPESMTEVTSAMYSEVECSFEKSVALCEPGKCVGLCIGCSV